MTGRLAPLPAADDLWEGEKVGVLVDGVPVLLVRLDGEVRAWLDRCAHQASRLSPGKLEDGVIVCPVHGWTYDARTGAGVNPRSSRLVPLPLVLRDGATWVDLAAGAP